MTNTVLLEADKARNFKYGINALIEMEELLGKPLAELQENPSIADLRIMVYCGLKWEDKKLTLEQTGDIIDAAGLEQASSAMTKALELAFGGSAGLPN